MFCKNCIKRNRISFRKFVKNKQPNKPKTMETIYTTVGHNHDYDTDLSNIIIINSSIDSDDDLMDYDLDYDPNDMYYELAGL